MQTCYFWPTIHTAKRISKHSTAKKALYCGNLGITHDVKSLSAEMTRLHQDGYEINFYGDGPRAKLLPHFVNHKKFNSEKEMIQVMVDHPIHLVAGTLRDDTGSLPSKISNSLYLGAMIIPCGFGEHLTSAFDEYSNIKNPEKNLDHLTDMIINHIDNKS